MVVLDVIERLERLVRGMDEDALLLVTEAYRRGASWTDIAHRLGRTKQTVHRRYQAHVHGRQTEELLRADLLEAQQRARQVVRHGTDGDEVLRAAAFLRNCPRPDG